MDILNAFKDWKRLIIKVGVTFTCLFVLKSLKIPVFSGTLTHGFFRYQSGDQDEALDDTFGDESGNFSTFLKSQEEKFHSSNKTLDLDYISLATSEVDNETVDLSGSRGSDMAICVKDFANFPGRLLILILFACKFNFQNFPLIFHFGEKNYPLRIVCYSFRMFSWAWKYTSVNRPINYLLKRLFNGEIFFFEKCLKLSSEFSYSYFADLFMQF